MINIAREILGIGSRFPMTKILSDPKQSLTGKQFTQTVEARTQELLSELTEDQRLVLVEDGRGLDFWVDICAVINSGKIAIPLSISSGNDFNRSIIEYTQPEYCLGEHSSSLLRSIQSQSDQDCGRPEVGVANETAMILFTSGTTGKPKGVMLSSEALYENMTATCRALPYSNGQRHLVTTKGRFISAISHFLVTLYAGAEFYFDENVSDPSSLVSSISKCRPDSFGGAPIHLQWLKSLESEQCTMKWVMSSGDRLPPKSIAELNERFPEMEVVVAYGATEAGGRICINRCENSIGSVGRPIDGYELTVLSMPDEESGEVVVSGSALFLGYLGNSAATDRVLSKAGYMTGDIGHLDDGGRLWLEGRSDSVFKRLGHKVSCLTIEEAANSTDMFSEVVVIPVEQTNQMVAPVLFYVPRHDLGEIGRGDVLKEIRSILPASHIPIKLLQLPSIPRTQSGKPQKAKLLEMYHSGTTS